LFFDKLIKTISSLLKENKEVILVTSGAIAVGMGKLGLPKKPKNMALKQACAALGQATLMNEYEKIASKYNLMCAQILVNHDDFESRSRMINLSNTFEELFNNKILPIVNENDALNVEEIKVGDNDTLSALIVPMINADLLVLASDIDGLYDKNPKQYPDAKKIDVVYKIDKTIDDMIGTVTSNVGTGGMETKIKAARIVTKIGCDMVIIINEDMVNIEKIINGDNKFNPSSKVPSPNKNLSNLSPSKKKSPNIKFK
jgi:glutamate 5-kinase